MKIASVAYFSTDLSSLSGPEGVEKHDDIVESLRDSLHVSEDVSRVEAYRQYEERVAAGETDLLAPKVYKWPRIAADRVKLMFLPGGDGRKKALFFVRLNA